MHFFTAQNWRRIVFFLILNGIIIIYLFFDSAQNFIRNIDRVIDFEKFEVNEKSKNVSFT